MMGGSRLFWIPAALLCVMSCAASYPSSPAPEDTRLDRAVGPPAMPAQNSLVFVVDGAGGFEAASRTIAKTITEVKLPLEVRTFHWTHGYCRVFSDQMHASHIQREGRELAELVMSCRQESPGRRIYLIGHSAGCGVALIAAEHLPPDALERIVLLAPAVSAKHDLRPALRSTCQGIDAFISSHDWCLLGVGTKLTGTTDRHWLTTAAGKTGFQPVAADPQDEALYTKLRQYPWNSTLMWTGHKGGHYGAYQPGFLRTFVFPLLQ